jgi:hypothetical protein
MTIDEIRRSLPNGFHDSDILSLHIDYLKGEVTFLMDIDLSSPDMEVDESSRIGELKLSGLLYCVIEPPAYSLGKDYIFCEDRLWITSDSSDFSLLKERAKLPEPMPDGGFRHWFFISSHKCLIYVAAMDATFQWREKIASMAEHGYSEHLV